jgi:diguanylate cyclase (GGDEF)-like protein
MRNNQLDALTGLLNRKAFDESLKTLMAGSKEKNAPLSLAFFDIDIFSKINEVLGHIGGDIVLKGVAAAMIRIVGERGMAARYGGDEFAIIFPDMEREKSFLIMEEIRAATEQLTQFSEGDKQFSTRLSISGGVAAFPIDAGDENELLRKADGALYRAKGTGRNKIILAFEERMFPKTAHYTQTQLERLSELSKEQGVSDAVLLREALDDLLTKYKHNFLFFDQLKEEG